MVSVGMSGDTASSRNSKAQDETRERRNGEYNFSVKTLQRLFSGSSPITKA